jgi:hypothetical protein
MKTRQNGCEEAIPFYAPGSSQVLMKGRLAREDQFESGNEQNRRQTK